MGVKHMEDLEELVKFHYKLDPSGLGIRGLRLCNEHFTEESYKRDLQAELCGTRRRYILKDDAVPTIFVHRYDRPDQPTSVSFTFEKYCCVLH
jgi:hypothetical protein